MCAAIMYVLTIGSVVTSLYVDIAMSVITYMVYACKDAYKDILGFTYLCSASDYKILVIPKTILASRQY